MLMSTSNSHFGRRASHFDDKVEIFNCFNQQFSRLVNDGHHWERLRRWRDILRVCQVCCIARISRVYAPLFCCARTFNNFYFIFMASIFSHSSNLKLKLATFRVHLATAPGKTLVYSHDEWTTASRDDKASLVSGRKRERRSNHVCICSARLLLLISDGWC